MCCQKVQVSENDKVRLRKTGNKFLNNMFRKKFWRKIFTSLLLVKKLHHEVKLKTVLKLNPNWGCWFNLALIITSGNFQIKLLNPLRFTCKFNFRRVLTSRLASGTFGFHFNSKKYMVFSVGRCFKKYASSQQCLDFGIEFSYLLCRNTCF